MAGKVLVVSKDTKLMEFIHRNLPNNGYQIINTRADEGLKSILDEVKPHLVILDIMMPQLDGIELCLSIRQWSQVPIILLSTWKTGADKVRGLDINSSNYLTRPMGGTEFRKQAERVFQHDSN
ncbi:MAG TPA: response regulator transcription factor [Chloroflexi bacterium]|nr:response regulator transcription factor [Chloroflexota bacterium]